MLINGINTILANLLLNNFIYNYFIASDFLYENKEEKSKEVAVNFFYFLTLTYMLNYLSLKLGKEYMRVEEIGYLIGILNTILATLLIARFRKLEGRRIYYATSVFLINWINPINIENILISSINIFILPLFIYLNLIFLCPMFNKLKIESKKALVSYRVIFIITIALISLIFKAFTGWYR